MRLLPKIEEDRPTPKEIYNFRTYLFAAIASAGAATIGYDSAFIGGTIALDSFKEEFSFAQKPPQEVDLISANIVSCYQAGAFFGAILAYLAGHFLGRRLGLLVFGPIFMLGAGLMLAASRERGLACIYAGRVIAGLSIGAISNLIPIYISELSPPAIRGRLVGMWEVGWQCGGLVGFWINVSVSFGIIALPIYIGRGMLSCFLQPVCCEPDAALESQAVDYSLRRSAHPGWHPDRRRSCHRRESAMAHQ